MQRKSRWLLSGTTLYLIGWIYFSNYVLAFIPILLIRQMVGYWEKILQEKEKANRLEQFHLFLNSMGAFVSSGNGLERAFLQCWSQLSDLYGSKHFVVQQLKLANSQFKNGVPIVKVITQIFIKFELEEALLSAHSIALLTKKGGDLSSYFYQITEIIREKYVTNQEIQIVRTQKRIEAIFVCCMPVLFMSFLKLSSPEFIQPLYSSLGHVLMGCSLLVWIICIHVVTRILSTRLT